MNQPNENLRTIADAYCQVIGLPAPIRGHYYEVDHAFAREICLAYEALPEIDTSEHCVKCYRALAEEVKWQFDFLRAAGYTFEPWQQEGQPYQKSCEMADDLRANKHLYFFTGGEVHPYLGRYSGVKLNGVACSFNDLFRAVHDVFGHAAEGYQFGQRGEENAWVHHSMMFHSLAQRALTTETRGQNSWVNESDANKGKPASEKAYAVQKAAILDLKYCR